MIEQFDITTETDSLKAKELLETKKYDLLLSDIVMQPLNGMHLLSIAKEHQPEIAVIMISGYAMIDISLDAVKKGAFDCISKPFRINEISYAVERALEYSQKEFAPSEYPVTATAKYHFGLLVAESAKMKESCKKIRIQVITPGMKEKNRSISEFLGSPLSPCKVSSFGSFPTKTLIATPRTVTAAAVGGATFIIQKTDAFTSFAF